MNRTIAGLPLFIAIVLASPLLAVPEPTADELKANRVQLENLRKHPDKLARLRRDVRLFLALPTERREQIVNLDEKLHEDAAAARLIPVLERYVGWLEQLPDVRSARDCEHGEHPRPAGADPGPARPRVDEGPAALRP